MGMAGCNKKPGDSVRQRRNMIQLAFCKDHSGHCVEDPR